MSIRSLVLLLPIAVAHAGTPIDQTRPLDVDGRIEVENLKGRILVRTWAQPQVRITGSLGKGAEKLLIEGDTQALRIKAVYPNRSGWTLWGREDRSEPTVLELTVPRGASLDLDAVSADIDVQQSAGRRVSASSVSGDVRITASSPGEARVETVSGDAFLRITTPKVSVETVSGNVDLSGGMDGQARMESASGDLRLSTASSLDRLDLSTVSGDAVLDLALATTGAIKAESVSGDLELSLVRLVDARVHAETFSGDIASPIGQVRREEHGPGSSLDARIGAGHGDINLQSFSGDVHLRQK